MVQSDKRTKQAARDARLAAALRENLKRRKVQARARDRAAGASGRRETRPDGSSAEGKK